MGRPRVVSAPGLVLFFSCSLSSRIVLGALVPRVPFSDSIRAAQRALLSNPHESQASPKGLYFNNPSLFKQDEAVTDDKNSDAWTPLWNRAMNLYRTASSGKAERPEQQLVLEELTKLIILLTDCRPNLLNGAAPMTTQQVSLMQGALDAIEAQLVPPSNKNMLDSTKQEDDPIMLLYRSAQLIEEAMANPDIDYKQVLELVEAYAKVKAQFADASITGPLSESLLPKAQQNKNVNTSASTAWWAPFFEQFTSSQKQSSVQQKPESNYNTVRKEQANKEERGFQERKEVDKDQKAETEQSDAPTEKISPASRKVTQEKDETDKSKKEKVEASNRVSSSATRGKEEVPSLDGNKKKKEGKDSPTRKIQPAAKTESLTVNVDGQAPPVLDKRNQHGGSRKYQREESIPATLPSSPTSKPPLFFATTGSRSASANPPIGTSAIPPPMFPTQRRGWPVVQTRTTPGIQSSTPPFQPSQQQLQRQPLRQSQQRSLLSSKQKSPGRVQQPSQSEVTSSFSVSNNPLLQQRSQLAQRLEDTLLSDTGDLDPVAVFINSLRQPMVQPPTTQQKNLPAIREKEQPSAQKQQQPPTLQQSEPPGQFQQPSGKSTETTQQLSPPQQKSAEYASSSGMTPLDLAKQLEEVLLSNRDGFTPDATEKIDSFIKSLRSLPESSQPTTTTSVEEPTYIKKVGTEESTFDATSPGPITPIMPPEFDVKALLRLKEKVQAEQKAEARKIRNARILKENPPLYIDQTSTNWKENRVGQGDSVSFASPVSKEMMEAKNQDVREDETPDEKPSSDSGSREEEASIIAFDEMLRSNLRRLERKIIQFVIDNTPSFEDVAKAGKQGYEVAKQLVSIASPVVSKGLSIAWQQIGMAWGVAYKNMLEAQKGAEEREVTVQNEAVAQKVYILADQNAMLFPIADVENKKGAEGRENQGMSLADQEMKKSQAKVQKWKLAWEDEAPTFQETKEETMDSIKNPANGLKYSPSQDTSSSSLGLYASTGENKNDFSLEDTRGSHLYSGSRESVTQEKKLSAENTQTENRVSMQDPSSQSAFLENRFIKETASDWAKGRVENREISGSVAISPQKTVTAESAAVLFIKKDSAQQTRDWSQLAAEWTSINREKPPASTEKVDIEDSTFTDIKWAERTIVSREGKSEMEKSFSDNEWSLKAKGRNEMDSERKESDVAGSAPLAGRQEVTNKNSAWSKLAEEWGGMNSNAVSEFRGHPNLVDQQNSDWRSAGVSKEKYDLGNEKDLKHEATNNQRIAQSSHKSDWSKLAEDWGRMNGERRTIDDPGRFIGEEEEQMRGIGSDNSTRQSAPLQTNPSESYGSKKAESQGDVGWATLAEEWAKLNGESTTTASVERPQDESTTIVSLERPKEDRREIKDDDKPDSSANDSSPFQSKINIQMLAKEWAERHRAKSEFTRSKIGAGSSETFHGADANGEGGYEIGSPSTANGKSVSRDENMIANVDSFTTTNTMNSERRESPNRAPVRAIDWNQLANEWRDRNKDCRP